MTLHPKTKCAGLGGALGVLIAGALAGAGVHLSPELAGALSTALSAVAAYFAPNPPTPSSPPTGGPTA